MRDSERARRVYRLYVEFFDRAERERRWNPYRDVPWERVNRSSARTVEVAARLIGQCGRLQ